MSASQATITFSPFEISREAKLRSAALADSIKFVGRGDNRRALVEAGAEGSYEAQRIVDLFFTVSGGNYHPDHIDELNRLVADWKASHA